MKKVLTRTFFKRLAPEVAPDLIGKYLVREIDGVQTSYMITETEAYEGTDDRASHASRGRTKRTEVMFGRPGVWYVYLIYGMYQMLNIVTGDDGHPSAVLVRGVTSISGPGRLTKRLEVTGAMNALPAERKSGLWIEDRGERIDPRHIKKTARIGVDYAGPVWAKKEWRFVYSS
ncbi:DNA-3-methyladenine glycosylase [Candidatus Kaiserbacteria bacterium]|nr:DNA-3-methyladenine glycosylase [Candidatus Kaiserbacteria bacterium]